MCGCASSVHGRSGPLGAISPRDIRMVGADSLAEHHEDAWHVCSRDLVGVLTDDEIADSHPTGNDGFWWGLGRPACFASAHIFGSVLRAPLLMCDQSNFYKTKTYYALWMPTSGIAPTLRLAQHPCWIDTSSLSFPFPTFCRWCCGPHSCHGRCYMRLVTGQLTEQRLSMATHLTKARPSTERRYLDMCEDKWRPAEECKLVQI
jgi:hypothetical protein